MAHRKLPHVVAYDIADPKRLGRVHRYLKKIALPLQYSVFLIELDERGREKVLRRLESLIHARFDDVRVYPLPVAPEWVALGKPLWGSGVMLSGFRLPVHLRGKVEVVE